MTDKRILVSKANELIAASYSLSVREQRLLLAAISLIYPKVEMPKEIIVTAEYYNSIFNVVNPWRDMNEGAKKLFDRFVIFENDLEHGKLHWLSEIGSAKQQGHVRIVFTDGMLPYLSLLSTRFSSYDLRRIAKLSSIYAIRIFEMLIQFQSTGFLSIGIDALKTRLNLSPGYDRIDNLRSKLLAPSLEDINEHTGLNVVYEILYQGRKATTVVFKFSDSWVTYPASKKNEKVVSNQSKQKGGGKEGRAGEDPLAPVSQNLAEEREEGTSADVSLEELVASREKALAHMEEIKRKLGRRNIVSDDSQET